MVETPQLDRALLSFQLASRLVELRYVAEMAWCSDDPADDADCPLMQRLRAVQQEVVALIKDFTAAGAGDQLSERATILCERIEQKLVEFTTQWSSEKHRRKLQQFREIDSEQEYDRERCLLQDSPVSRGQLEQTVAAAKAFAGEMQEADQACFEAGYLLTTQHHPTFSGGERQRPAEEELAHIRVHLHRKLRSVVSRLVEHFPFLAEIAVDLSTARRWRANEEIGRLCEKIPELLQNPSLADAKYHFLGIVTEKASRTVYRGGGTIRLSGEIAWKLLELLLASGPRFCSYERLQTAWPDELVAEEERVSGRNAFDQAIRELRNRLLQIGITVENARNMGWRLASAPEPNG